MLESLISTVTTFALTAGVKIVISIIILIAGFKLIHIFMDKLKNGSGMKRVDNSVRTFTISFLNIALKIILVITVAAYLGVPMTSMVALVGSMGVAIGLALQGGLSNIASGIMILTFRPYSVGNYIKCGDLEGSVISIGIFHTSLCTVDNKHVIIPNSVLTSSSLTNFSVEETRRVDLDFTASYTADVDLVKKTLLDTAESCDKVLTSPAIEVMMVSHEDSAVKYRLRAWCNSSDYWSVYFSLVENVKRNFDKAGIEIPYPQIDVHMENKD